jgi:PKD repeat protein
MKTFFSISLLFWFLVFGNYPELNAQVNQGGTPYSFIFQVDNSVQSIQLQQPDMKKIEAEDLAKDQLGGPAPKRMGVSVEVGKDMLEVGTWSKIDGLGSICMLELEVPGAKALGVYYENFFIPEGGKLFLYNHDKTHIIGAFTSENNPSENLFSTEFVQGDKVILEYFQPENIAEKAQIFISELAYAYRFISFAFTDDTRDQSWPCMINVACEEGDDWWNQIDGVARISIKIGPYYYWCSGSLINNTNNDRTPYFLTAAHCGENATSADLNQWIFYFNYQAASCSGTSSGYNSMTGCSLKANDPTHADGGSDFYLVRINGTIPNSYGVFYNGWNRTNSNEDAGSGVGVHHPAGDIKKISTYDTPITSSTFWNGLPTHWKLIWAETVNGLSIMQGGSSGSPIFDSNGLIMGDLTGGYESNSCDNPSPAYYGKIWYSWDQNGDTPATRLKDWLDPDETGIEKLPGVSWQNIPPIADFSANNTEIIQGDTVFFTDLSEPGILEWLWLFDGAEPDSAFIADPWTVYSDTGYFDVSIYVVNADGDDTELKQNYIHVSPMAPPVADFEANDTIVALSTVVDFSDLSSGNPTSWSWEFEGGSPAVSTQKNPKIRYNSEGIFDVKLIAYNLGGSDTLIKEEYITAGGTLPEANFEADRTNIQQGETVNFTDLSTGNPIEWYWQFDGAEPSTSTEQNPQNIMYPEGGAFSVSLSVNNGLGQSDVIFPDYILVDWVGIKEPGSSDGITIYPNPGTGLFNITFASSLQKVSIEVADNFGKIVHKESYNQVEESISLDLNFLSNGIYFVNILAGEKMVNKKITLIK